ncbi:mRNA decapping enzyme [Vairimorpha necatrix]|uniref:mRNA decapping enzyme n=1 Tax=Vairimorpha necatrix TaxID=6039 RepID=A0AAX4JE86_9MICR
MIKHFKVESVNLDQENIIYIGTIQSKPAICIFPKKSILQDEFLNIINEETELKLHNDIYYAYTVKSRVDLKFRLIWPATQKYNTKYSSKKIFTKESYDQYLKLPHEPVVWIDNIIKGKEEKFKYYEDDKFILMPNYKWNELSTDDLQILLVFKDSNLRSIRDIKDEKLLEEGRDIVIENLKQFKLGYEDVVMFFHYKPTYEHLHLHVANINLEGSASLSVTRARLLEDVIYNIKIDKDYYKRDIWYSKKTE